MQVTKSMYVKNIMVLLVIILYSVVFKDRMWVIIYSLFAIGVELFFYWLIFMRKKNMGATNGSVSMSLTKGVWESQSPANQMVVNVTMSSGSENVECKLLIDTGCNRGVVLSEKMIKKLNLIARTNKVSVWGVHGRSEVYEYALKSMTIDGKTFEDVAIRECPSQEDIGYEGLLGLDVISHFGMNIKKDGDKFIYSFGDVKQ